MSENPNDPVLPGLHRLALRKPPRSASLPVSSIPQSDAPAPMYSPMVAASSAAPSGWSALRPELQRLTRVSAFLIRRSSVRPFHSAHRSAFPSEPGLDNELGKTYR